jgi:hypothetical protein
VTPIPIHIGGPLTSTQISEPNRTQAAANIFAVEDTSFSLSLDASDAEFQLASVLFIQEGLCCKEKESQYSICCFIS